MKKSEKMNANIYSMEVCRSGSIQKQHSFFEFAITIRNSAA